jgi:hypothetical protein
MKKLFTHFINTSALADTTTGNLYNAANTLVGVSADADYLVIGAVAKSGQLIYPLYASRPRFVQINALTDAENLSLCPASISVGLCFGTAPAALLIATESHMPPVVNLLTGIFFTGGVRNIRRGAQYLQADVELQDSVTEVAEYETISCTLAGHESITDDVLRSMFRPGQPFNGQLPAPFEARAIPNDTTPGIPVTPPDPNDN